MVTKAMLRLPPSLFSTHPSFPRRPPWAQLSHPFCCQSFCPRIFCCRPWLPPSTHRGSQTSSPPLRTHCPHLSFCPSPLWVIFCLGLPRLRLPLLGFFAVALGS